VSTEQAIQKESKRADAAFETRDFSPASCAARVTSL
jgi:hypothetical protein